jgi:putative Holliday junction resolvase
MSKTLGLDVGDSKIGVALSDILRLTAQGVTTFQRKNVQTDLGYLRQLITENEVTEVVVGLPVMMNGERDAQTKKILRFAQLLRQTFHIPVITWDERFSTIEANKTLELGKVGKKKRAALLDKVAAIIILQGYLDSRNDSEIPFMPSFS